MTTEDIDLGDMGRRRDELAAAASTVLGGGPRTGGRGSRPGGRASLHGGSSIRELHAMNIEVVTSTGDNEATARRIVDQRASTL